MCLQRMLRRLRAWKRSLPSWSECSHQKNGRLASWQSLSNKYRYLARPACVILSSQRRMSTTVPVTGSLMTVRTALHASMLFCHGLHFMPAMHCVRLLHCWALTNDIKQVQGQSQSTKKRSVLVPVPVPGHRQGMLMCQCCQCRVYVLRVSTCKAIWPPAGIAWIKHDRSCRSYRPRPTLRLLGQPKKQRQHAMRYARRQKWVFPSNPSPPLVDNL